ncbi:hypothetical protein OG250_31965 [Streptomyces sp. NBC_00487]|uniref:hypothetical protein n=1 Tax=unclassified Streptomyces TaxID=2593676 RepID=UPI002E19FF8D|nr:MULTISPECIES: hypothetical protein [unclassified Streptomyces]
MKSNLDKGVRAEWPWRFTLLESSTCAAVVALLVGVMVTRTQLSLTMHPVLSWAAGKGGSDALTESQRTVRVVNGGGGRSVVRSVLYRIEVNQVQPSARNVPADWISWHEAVDVLNGIGLTWNQDYFLQHIGSGASLPMATDARNGMEVLALGPDAAGRLSRLDVRIQVVDVLGDVYERDLQCVRPAPAAGR